jgi:hypothetical protein
LVGKGASDIISNPGANSVGYVSPRSLLQEWRVAIELEEAQEQNQKEAAATGTAGPCEQLQKMICEGASSAVRSRVPRNTERPPLLRLIGADAGA